MDRAFFNRKKINWIKLKKSGLLLIIPIVLAAGVILSFTFENNKKHGLPTEIIASKTLGQEIGIQSIIYESKNHISEPVFPLFIDLLKKNNEWPDRTEKTIISEFVEKITKNFPIALEQKNMERNNHNVMNHNLD